MSPPQPYVEPGPPVTAPGGAATRRAGRLSRRDLVIMGALAAAVRIAYWVVVTPTWVPASDADQYLFIARNLAEGRGFSLTYPQLELHATAFRPPLYPALLAPFALLSDGLWSVRLPNVVLGAAVAMLAAALTARIAGRRAGLVAGALVAVYPPLLANDTVTLTEPLALALLLVIVLCIDDRRWEWAGVATGALMLTRPNVYAVALIVIVLATRHAGWRTAVRTAAAVLVVVVPWLVRNQVQVGTPRLVTSDGFTLAAIFAPLAQDAGHFVDPVFDPAYDGDLELRRAQFDEAVWSRELLERAGRGIRDDPAYLLTNAADNVTYLFELEPSDNESAEVFDGRSLTFRRATLPAFYVVTVLGLVGMWRNRRDRRVLLLGVLGIQFALLCIVILAPPRLRAPFDLMCCLGAGLVIDELLARRGTAALGSGERGVTTGDALPQGT